MDPVAKMPKITVLKDTGGAAPRRIEDRTLTMAIATPAKSVRLTSPVEHISGDAADSRKLPDIVRDTGEAILGEEAVFELPASAGKGG